MNNKPVSAEGSLPKMDDESWPRLMPKYDECTPDEARRGEDYARVVMASGYGGDTRDAISMMFAYHLASRRIESAAQHAKEADECS